MLYKLYYELDNGYRFEDVWSVVFSQFPLTNEGEVKVFLHRNIHTRSDECVRRVYEIKPLTYTGKDELIMQKVEY